MIDLTRVEKILIFFTNKILLFAIIIKKVLLVSYTAA